MINPPSKYIVRRRAPPNRRGTHTGTREEHMPEVCVMFAFAAHLMARGATEVRLSPDGEQGKRLDIRRWLKADGFGRTVAHGSTRYGGDYARDALRIAVRVKGGEGDVVAKVGGRVVIAECKGGCINTKHHGQQSKLRRGLCEAVAQLLARELGRTERHIAVVPRTPVTERLAAKLASRARLAGLEIALVDRGGEIQYVKPESRKA